MDPDGIDIDGREAPTARLIAEGDDWAVCDYVCHADARSRPFEERHERVVIAAVVEGLFNYSTDTGKALLHPGAVMLGNSGACYECGHQHSVGDRCIAIRLDPDYFAEIAASEAGTAHYGFPAAMLPATRGSLAQIARLERLSRADPVAVGQAVAEIVAGIVRGVSGAGPLTVRVSARDEQRIGRTLRHIEDNAGERLDLDALSAIAGMSKFHFLRTFKKTIGVTPHQFVLGIRLRRAAIRLAGSTDSVAAICYEAGFGDLSTFNVRFRDLFGMSPMAFRRAEGV